MESLLLILVGFKSHVKRVLSEGLSWYTVFLQVGLLITLGYIIKQ